MRQAVRVFGIRRSSRRVAEWGPNSRPQYFLENNHRVRQQKLRISDGSLYASRTRPSNTGRHKPGITFHADSEIALRTRFDHALSDTPRADTRRDRRLVRTKTRFPRRTPGTVRPRAGQRSRSFFVGRLRESVRRICCLAGTTR